MRKYLFTVISLFLLLSCGKEDSGPREEDGGAKTVGIASGSFPVLVSTNGVWKAGSSDKWIHIDDVWHKDRSAFVVRYDSNESTDGDRHFNRIGTIRVETWDGTIVKTISLRQYGMEPFMSIPDQSVSSEEGRQSISFFTNLTDMERPGLTFSSNSSAIINLVWDEDGESISFDTTPGTEGGVIEVKFTDAWGQVFVTSGTISRY